MLVFLFVPISCGLCQGQPHELQIKECLPAGPKYMSTVARANFFMEKCLVTFKMGVTGRKKRNDKFYIYVECILTHSCGV